MVVLITGASGGIGAACAEIFAKNGDSVAINYCKNETAAVAIKEKIEEAGGTAKCYKADVSVTDEVNAMVSAVESDFGPVDVLINNAGVWKSGLLHDMSDEEYDWIMGTNLGGTFKVSRAVLPSMISRKSGCIINISSMWGLVGSSCESIYSASKAGIIGLTKAMAKEVGPSGIRVNSISPGVIDTPMNAGFSSDDIETLCDETPLGVIGKPEDIAKTALFLAKEDCFITGQDIGVNGGFVI